MVVSLIAALAQNHVIGKNNHLPWTLPDDMSYFMKKTIHHHVIMGRKSYDALPEKFKPLPHRTNIVVTRSHSRPKTSSYIVVRSLEEGIQLAKHRMEHEVFIIGGAQIYQCALSLSQRMYLTEIKATIDGDVFFPNFDKNKWIEVSRKNHTTDKRHAFSFDYVEYRRKT